MVGRIVIEQFEKILALCEELEGETISVRLKRRIACAHMYAIEKAIAISFEHAPNEEYLNRSLFRHAERGAREFVEFDP